MLEFKLTNRINKKAMDQIRNLENPDLTPLAQKIEEIIKGENERRLKAGENFDGKTTAPLKPSTIERGRGGFGPPRIPRFDGSWPIAKFEIVIEKTGKYALAIRAGWPTVPYSKYHQTGTKKKDGSVLMAARPLAGISTSTRAQLKQASDKFARDLLRGNP
jgi:hypothetical protein